MRSIGPDHVLVPLGPRMKERRGLVVFNEPGRFMWDLLASEQQIDDLAAAMATRFEVDTATARADAAAFVAEIAQMGLLVR